MVNLAFITRRLYPELQALKNVHLALKDDNNTLGIHKEYWRLTMRRKKAQKTIENRTREHESLAEEKMPEHPTSRDHNDHAEPGIYVDIVSGDPLFASCDRYAVGRGWPIFTRPILSASIKALRDTSCGMLRTEVRSMQSDKHLGYVFPDGPPDKGGLRYSLNYTSLRFVHRDDMVRECYAEYLNRAR